MERRHTLILEIEKARSQLCSLASKHHLCSDEMVKISTYLDKLLNTYQKQQTIS